MTYRNRKRTRSATKEYERQCKKRKFIVSDSESDNEGWHSDSESSDSESIQSPSASASASESGSDLHELLNEADEFINYEPNGDDEPYEPGQIELDQGAKDTLSELARTLVEGIFMGEEEQVSEELKEVHKETVEMEKELMGTHEDDMKPLKWRILKSEAISDKSKRAILPMIDNMLQVEPGSETYGKYKQYVECIERMPFGKYIEPVVESTATPYDIAVATNRFYTTINKCLYGQQAPKNKLTQIIHNGFTNPSASPQVIGLQGPPGIGKTTLIKYGLSVAQNRPFFMYPLGGAKEGGYLEGFNMAFIGATNGWVSNSLIVGRCMNPVFFFDELDKVSETREGREIIGVLMRLIDPTQNNVYCDRFLPGVELDLSKAIFIFSYNHREKVDPILMDRITEIKMEGYNLEDKKIICREYIIKEMAEKVGMTSEDVIFSDNILEFC